MYKLSPKLIICFSRMIIILNIIWKILGRLSFIFSSEWIKWTHQNISIKYSWFFTSESYAFNWPLDTGHRRHTGQSIGLVYFISFIIYSLVIFCFIYSRHRFDLTRSETLSHSQRVSVYLNAINLVRSINVVNDFIFTCPQKLNSDMCMPSANKYTAIRRPPFNYNLCICVFECIACIHHR